MECKNCGTPLRSGNKYGYCTSRKRPECRRLYYVECSKAHYQSDREAVIERVGKQQKTDSARKEYMRVYRKQRTGWWRDVVSTYKVSKGCELCGFRSPRAGYFDLDHRDRSTKLADISALCAQLDPQRPEHVERFIAEVRKCQVLCTACHREKTAEDLSITPEDLEHPEGNA